MPLATLKMAGIIMIAGLATLTSAAENVQRGEANERLKAKPGCRPALPAQRSVSPLRIVKGAFVLNSNEQPFIPRGFNYVRLDLEGKGSHATFSPFVYDRNRTVAAFRHMAAGGFNVVRIFINGFRGQRGCMFKNRDAQKPDSAYLDNLAEFLLLARRHGIFVVPCFEFFPQAGPYRQGLQALENVGPRNAEYLNQTYIDAKKRYLRDVICELRKRNPDALSAVFCWDLMNELCYHLGDPPFSVAKGNVTPANDITYDLATDKTRLADEMAVYWIDQLAAAVRAEIPGALINANVFTYRAVGRSGPGDFHREKAAWKNRYPFRPTALLRSTADVIDIHIYASNPAELRADMKSIEHSRLRAALNATPNKAFIVGEFGVFKATFPKLPTAAAWVADMSRCFPNLGAAGWMYWTYDTDEQERLWNAKAGQGMIFGKLKR